MFRMLRVHLPRGGRSILAMAALAGCLLSAGCAALSNPVANGIPVRRLSPELLGESRTNLELISLASLRQPPPDAYRLGPEDVLGVWIEGVIGEKNQAPPVVFSQNPNTPPGLGFPVPVRSDGTLSLPFIPPLNVTGKTLEETEGLIRKAYTVDTQILKPGQERIIVTVQRPRQFQVLVIRSDAFDPSQAGQNSTQPGGSRGIGFVVGVGGSGPRGTRRGQGFSLGLPAYENDVLNALARTGGLPGTDAVNEIIIERGAFTGDTDKADVIKGLETMGKSPALARQTIRIPLRMRPGEKPSFRPEDIILKNGDIVYIEAREQDVYYTAGLLPAGQYILPRDSDLDVVEAVAQAGGTLDAGTINASNVSGTFLTPGLGSPSPSLLTVIRRLPNGSQVAIKVDINRALTDPRERILVQPRDVLVLQETPQEAFTRYFAQTFQFSIFYQWLTSSHSLGTTTLTGPQ
jgi:protein involved in polysaccharide export with SLBB domain